MTNRIQKLKDNSNRNLFRVSQLTFIYLLCFFLTITGYYFYNWKKIIKHSFIQKLCFWISLIIVVILSILVTNKINDFSNLIIATNNQHVINIYKQGFVNQTNFQLSHLIQYWENQTNFLVVLNNSQINNITELSFDYLSSIIYLKVIFSFMIIFLISLFWNLLLIANLFFKTIKANAKLNALLFLELIFNPFGAWITYYNSKKIKVKFIVIFSPIKYIQILNEYITIIKKIFFWIQNIFTKNKEKITDFDFPKNLNHNHAFVDAQKILFSYHSNKGWNWLEHSILNKLSKERYNKHMIKKNTAKHLDKKISSETFLPVLNELDVQIKSGKFTSILGANGSGKSTLIKVILKQIRGYHGAIYWAGKNLKLISHKEFAKNVANIAQSQNIVEGNSVYDFVSYGRSPYLKLMSFLSKNDRDIINMALKKTGLLKLSQKMVSNLSGGQQQKVLLAMALAQTTDTIILDEPTTFLDIRNQYEMLEILKEMQNEGKTIIAILHDINQAIEYSDEIIMMKDGKILNQGKPDEIISSESLKNIFGLKTKIIVKNNKKFISEILPN